MSTDDPFDIFDPPPAAAATTTASSSITATKKSRPSPILPLVRRFLNAHAFTTCADLKADDAAPLAALLEKAANNMAAEPPALDECRAAAEEVATIAWAELSNATAQQNKHAALSREAYVLAQAALCGVSAALDGNATAAIKSLDRAFILGGVTDLYRDCIELLDEEVMPLSSAAEEPAVESYAPPPPPLPPQSTIATTAATPVERIPCPSSADAFLSLHKRGKPLILEGVATSWPAMRKWSDLQWLRKQHGERLVPVELGSLTSATKMTKRKSATWGERIMSLSDFLDKHVVEESSSSSHDGSGSSGSSGSDATQTSPSNNSSSTTAASSSRPIGYLAQHPLFEQIPRLRRDFTVPPLCAVNGSTVRHVNAWLGPCGTVTPLHFDSYDNVLTQVVGYKRIKLYGADQTRYLYAIDAANGGGGGIDAQGNVSAVDVEAPDLERFPLFAEAKGQEVVLGPGDGLYVPAGCWHHVRSLSRAFSVSFWFDGWKR